MVRRKHRYLLVSLIFPGSLRQRDPVPRPAVTEKELVSLLRESLGVNFGQVGQGEVGGAFGVKYLSQTTGLCILRVVREHARTLWTACTLLRRLGGQTVVLRVVHVSGTIRKLQEAAIAHNRAILLAASTKRAKLPEGEKVTTLTAEEDLKTEQQEKSNIMAVPA